MRFRLRWALTIFLIALVLRCVFLLEFQSVPLAQTPTMDMEYHHQWATAIAEGREFIDGAFFRAPLYPTFLGVIYAVFGDSFRAASVRIPRWSILTGSSVAVGVIRSIPTTLPG
ncbi:MAG: hypothetical protein KAT79_00720 [candidate division Zixibacteria bacterium]|nr:hypothetical protein [candidate division Zixibacteria bacterium]